MASEAVTPAASPASRTSPSDGAAAGAFVGAIDQGTTSTRFIIFDREANVVASAQKEHRQITNTEGHVEHSMTEVWTNVVEVIEQAMAKAGLEAGALAAIGVTNQRETTVVWDKTTGAPLCNAIVWMDARSAPICDEIKARLGGRDALMERAGIPIVPYFSGTKLRWILDHHPEIRAAAERGDAVFGTVDSWVVWNLTGGTHGGAHVTDVTNASRTLLMNMDTLEWDDTLCRELGVPRRMLPVIKSSSEVYGTCTLAALRGVPVAGILGDQQSALVGHACFHVGDTKNTYGTGCFLLQNTGRARVTSHAGLMTTVAYKFGASPAMYGLEGSVAQAGTVVQWLTSVGLTHGSRDAEMQAQGVTDNGGVFLVPAFTGLFAPHWRDEARGILVGLTRATEKGHVARAALESTAFQSTDVLDLMRQGSGVAVSALKVDGGMVVNETLMQFQADIANTRVIRPTITEATAFGAAIAAGLAVGVWKDLDEVERLWKVDRVYEPKMEPAVRAQLRRDWSRALARTFHWLLPASAGVEADPLAVAVGFAPAATSSSSSSSSSGSSGSAHSSVGVGAAPAVASVGVGEASTGAGVSVGVGTQAAGTRSVASTASTAPLASFSWASLLAGAALGLAAGIALRRIRG